MKTLGIAAIACLFNASAFGANILVNGDFELGTPPDADNWEEIGAAPPNATIGLSGVDPANGTGHGLITIDNTSSAIPAGIFFQQVTPFGSVDDSLLYNLSFNARVASPDFTGINIFAEVQFLDQDGSHGGGVKGSINQSLVGSIGTSYQPFLIPDLDPELGADAALVRFQLAAGPIDGIQNSLFVDDAVFEAVPEPSAIGLAALGSVAFLMRRRRGA